MLQDPPSLPFYLPTIKVQTLWLITHSGYCSFPGSYSTTPTTTGAIFSAPNHNKKCKKQKKKFKKKQFTPVVTRFFCPPDIPRCIASPTRISAHTSSPKIYKKEEKQGNPQDKGTHPGWNCCPSNLHWESINLHQESSKWVYSYNYTYDFKPADTTPTTTTTTNFSHVWRNCIVWGSFDYWGGYSFGTFIM